MKQLVVAPWPAFGKLVETSSVKVRSASSPSNSSFAGLNDTSINCFEPEAGKFVGSTAQLDTYVDAIVDPSAIARFVAGVLLSSSSMIVFVWKR